MIAGGVGMAVYAAAVIPLLRRTRPMPASLSAIGIWTVVAAIVAVPLLVA
jgi:hypothetical protein